LSKFVLSAFADEIDPDLNIQMDVLDQHDIKYIEMRGVNGKGVVEYSTSEVIEIKKKLDDRGFKISAVGSPIGKIKINDDFEAHLDKFKHTIEIAHILEAKHIRMFSFFIPSDEDAANYRDEVMERWSRFVDAAKGSNIILLHENEKGIYGDTPERCFDLIKTMNCDYVRMTFDPANFVQCDVEVYPHAYNMLKSYIEYVHIKDALYDGHSVVPAGNGDGKIHEVLTDLNNSGYEGFLSIEPHLGKFKGLDQLELDNTKIKGMRDGGPKLFAVAVDSLKKVLSKI